MKFESALGLLLLLFLPSLCFVTVQSQCTESCDLALASYYLWPNSTLSFIGQVLRSSMVSTTNLDPILSYNKQITNRDVIQAFTRINVPFPCECLDGSFLAHRFQYRVRRGDTYDLIASKYYANLTTSESLQSGNSYQATNIPEGATINVTVNCSCGNRGVSTDYGLFISYPLRPEDSLDSIASSRNLSQSLIQRYNPNANFNQGRGLVYIPGRGVSYFLF